ncbi:hypothetical protein AX17_000649 [Amanita inopinata Kibby_2008]|nr:hypothetical protein AX17_000649 [Amanita inopinata Kibby_2008]
MSVPPLPKIDGEADIILDIYTHSSLSRNHSGLSDLNEEYGSPERLALLGKEVLNMTTTYHWYRRSPPLSAEQLQAKHRESLSEQRLLDCIAAYNLKRKLRYAPGAIVDSEVCRAFLDKYVGALYIRNGLPTVQEWVSKLVDPNAPPEDHEMMDATSRSYLPPPPQPSQPPPPAPPDYTPPIGYGGGNSDMITLAAFNQTALQKGYIISWGAQSIGPPHQPTWTVRCCLNDVEKGRGTGKSQKAAKEEAARQAWGAMNGFL